MGVAYYPVFEREIPGLNPATAVSGKSIAKAIEALDKLAKRLGVTPLSAFYSESSEETFANIGEDVPDDIEEPPIQWFNAAEGLATIRAIASHLRSNPGDGGAPKGSFGSKPSAAEMLADLEKRAAKIKNLNPGEQIPSFPKRDQSLLPSSDAILKDLAQLESVLVAAQQHHVHFRLRIDI